MFECSIGVFDPTLVQKKSGRNHISSSANFENSPVPHVRSLSLKGNDACYEQSLMSPYSSNFPTYTYRSDASVHVDQAQVRLDKNQGGWNYLSSPANSYMPSVAAPIIG